MSSDPHRVFRQAVACADDQIDLALAALALAASDCPGLDVDDYLSRIDQLATAVRDRAGDVTGTHGWIASINNVLFNEWGFHGNRDDYYDPRNSYLNEVIDRRSGIPITLSVLYMAVARRIGITLHGVGFPGHFLVKYASGKDQILIDPFHGGEIRSREDLENLLNQLYGAQLAFQTEFLAAINHRQILRRMLNNLKMIYLESGDTLKALSVLERLIILDPDAAVDLRDRGLLYLKLECFGQALADLDKYLALDPDAQDAAAISEQMVSLRKRVSQIH